MSEHVVLAMDPDGYWGGVDRDWYVAITESPRRPHQLGAFWRKDRETTGWLVKWAEKRLVPMLLRDEVIVATSDDGEKRIEWRGGKRVQSR